MTDRDGCSCGNPSCQQPQITALSRAQTAHDLARLEAQPGRSWRQRWGRARRHLRRRP